MKFRSGGSNRFIVEFKNGVEVLFSYDVPCAVHIPGHGYSKTDGFLPHVSVRHVNEWAGSDDVPMIPHASVVAYLNAGTGELTAPGYTESSASDR